MKKRSSMKFLMATFLIFVSLVLANTVWCYEVIVFGPKTYTRDNGKPQVITDTFSASQRIGDFHLLIKNGENGNNRVSSAIVRINGLQILGPSDFSQQVDSINKPINLTGTNKLQVELRSTPGSFFTLKIVGNLRNSPPVANAGSDQTVSEGDTVTLDGNESNDPDGDPLTFVWSFSSKPAGSAASLLDPTTANPTFVADLPGTYEIQLIVSDGYEFSSADVVQITASKRGVQFTLDEGKKVSSEITPEGGTLATQGADGTKFTLTIPPGALLNPKVISLTPIVFVTGLPLNSRILAAVHMGPSGLKFETPVSLTVEFLTPPSIQHILAGFLFQDDGTDFSLVPASLNANVTTFQIDHFTGGGLMEPTDEEMLNFAIDAYYGTGGFLDALLGVNSCEEQSLDNAINKTVNFQKLAEFESIADIPFQKPQKCYYPDVEDKEPLCRNIFDLAEAARQSLENVIKDVFVQLDTQCKNDPSKEVEALKCIAAVQGERVLPIFIDESFDETLMGMKTCGLSSLSIQPGKTCLMKGESTTWEAIALDKSGNRLFGREMRWGGGEPIVSLSASGDTAAVTGINEGQTSIKVFDKMTADALRVAIQYFNYDEATITVNKPNVLLMPASACIVIGDTIPLKANVTDCLGNPYTGCTVTWNAIGAADVNASGLVTGIAEGQANISAVCGDGIGFANIKVVKPSVTVTPGQATIRVCDTKQLTATVMDCLGNPYTGCTMTWFSNNTDVAVVDASGLVTAKHGGQANISAVCGDSIEVATITVKGFTGVWDTNWGGPNTPMSITVSEGLATGTYHFNSIIPNCPGRVDGTIDGNLSGHGCILTGTWHDNGAYAIANNQVSCGLDEGGTINFHLSPDGDSFTGSYTQACDSGDCGGSWNGVRRVNP
jgi:uncharacterized protein YjdB